MKFASFALWISLAAALQAGKLDFKSPVKEINAAADAQTVTADFEFTNRSGKTVVISNYEASCSCMTVQIKDAKTRYENGESGVVRATFDMGNFSGDVDKVVTLWLDGEKQSGEPSVQLLTKVHIPVLVGLNPKTVAWEIGEKPTTKVIKILMKDQKPINVRNVQSTSQGFKYEWKAIKEGWHYELSITPASTEKPAIGIFRIETDCAIKKHRTQQCFASVRKTVTSR